MPAHASTYDSLLASYWLERKYVRAAQHLTSTHQCVEYFIYSGTLGILCHSDLSWHASLCAFALYTDCSNQAAYDQCICQVSMFAMPTLLYANTILSGTLVIVGDVWPKQISCWVLWWLATCLPHYLKKSRNSQGSRLKKLVLWRICCRLHAMGQLMGCIICNKVHSWGCQVYHQLQFQQPNQQCLTFSQVTALTWYNQNQADPAVQAHNPLHARLCNKTVKQAALKVRSIILHTAVHTYIKWQSPVRQRGEGFGPHTEHTTP